MNTRLRYIFEDEQDEQVSSIIFHSHDQLFEIPGAIQLKDYLHTDSAWRNCTPDLIFIKFRTGQKIKVTDYIIGPNNAHLYIFDHFYNFQPRSNLYVIDHTTETTENFFLYKGQLNCYKATLRLDLKHKFHRNYTLNNIGALHLTNRYEENSIRNFYNHIYDEDEGFSEI